MSKRYIGYGSYLKKVLHGERRDLITLNILDSNPVSLIVSWLTDFKKGSEHAVIKLLFQPYVTNKAQSKKDDPIFIDENGDTVCMIRT